MPIAVQWLIACALAYLAGSIPFGLLIGLSRGIDIREHGSKNIGATNAGRVLGRTWGAVCFVLDLLKGLLPVLGAGAWFGLLNGTSPAALMAWAWIGVAACTIAGHMFPVWIGFKGGKGVATSAGALAGLWPALTIPVIVAALVWFVVVKRTGYVSLGSMVAAATVPVAAALRPVVFAVSEGRAGESLARLIEAWPFIAMSVLLAALVIVKHRANIARLRAGTESRVAWAGRTSAR